MQLSIQNIATELRQRFGDFQLQGAILLADNWVDAAPAQPKFSLPLKELGFPNVTGSFQVYSTWSRNLIATIDPLAQKSLSTNLAIELAREFGTDQIILTASAWSLDSKLDIGTTALVTDHINLTGRKPNNALHLPQTDTPYSVALNEKLIRTDPSLRKNLTLLQVGGVRCETSAEYRMFRTLGAEAVCDKIAFDALVAQGMGLKVSALVDIEAFAPGIITHSYQTHSSHSKLKTIISNLISVF